MSSTLNVRHINAAVILIYSSSPATFMFVSRPYHGCSPSIHHIPLDDPFFLHHMMIPPLHSPVPTLPRQPCWYFTSPSSLWFCQFISGCLLGLLPFVIFGFLWLLPVNLPDCLSVRTWASEISGRCSHAASLDFDSNAALDLLWQTSLLLLHFQLSHFDVT